MTTTDAAAVRRLHPRVALAVLMAWAGLGLAGCETGGSFGNFFGSNNIFGSSGSSQIAEPLAPAKPAEAQPALAKVTVAPIIGAPDGVAKQIQDEFSGAVERQRVTVSTAKDDRVDYILRGSVEVHTEVYEPTILSAGEAMYIDSTMRHAFVTTRDEPAVMLNVCHSPRSGHFRTLVEMAKAGVEEGVEMVGPAAEAVAAERKRPRDVQPSTKPNIESR